MEARETGTTPALERLAELVRQAEAKTRARKIEGETTHAAEVFRASELRARRAVERLRLGRPASMKALEQADHDEQVLKDLVRKLALYKSTLSSESDAERLIAASQAEIERNRRQARVDLEEIAREVEEARRDLRVATDQYRQLRRELDRLQPELAERFSAEDRLLWDAEAHFPGGQLQLLGHEVDAGLTAFPTLNKLEQYARLKVWIGRFRSYQAAHERDSELTEELQALSHRVFHQLKWLSRQYEPGYIEAFRQDFTTDWTAYVAEAQEQLLQAMELGRRARDADASTAATMDRPMTAPASSQAQIVRVASTHCLVELRAIVARARLPHEGLDQFLELLRKAIEDVGAAHPDLLRLTLPFREHINGENGLDVLRRNLERVQARREENGSRDGPDRS
jgi:hypothetical protein